ncbi:MAG TPA: TonB-dependent receptor [Terriglobales bacterium]|nr:TonB-dependent receptor [Terriglobales bacterium]
MPLFRRASSSQSSFGFAGRLLLAAIILLLTARPAAQDASTGALRGTVLDPDGSSIAGATVALVSNDTGARQSAATDLDGNYAFELLPPGNYTARVEAPGMSAQLSPPLHIEIGASTNLQFHLKLAGVKESVTVSGAPPLVETQPSAVSSLIDEKAISDLPLNGRRFTDLALLAPGVTQDPRGLTSASNGDLAFGGIRGYQSSYLVDGADNNNAFFGQARGRYRAPYQFSNEVVQEFRVSSNSYGAELGRAGGAVVNVVTKSGSNHWHGTGFYFIRDSSLNAQHSFTDTKPEDRQQQFGFTLGGPIKRNKIFFFSGFDQHVFRVPSLVRFVGGAVGVVPQPAAPGQSGDYEPSDQQKVFAAADQLNSMVGNYKSQLLGNAMFLKVDFSASPRHYLSARLNTSRYWGQNNVFFDPASPITTSMISNNGQENVATESGSLSLTSGLSPRITSHLRAQFSRDLQNSSANTSSALTKIYDVTDGFGRSSILPRTTREHKFHLTETLSLETGHHSFKFGGDALLSWIYNFFPSLFGGEYIFDTISVNPWTYEPMYYGMHLSPLRAYAHQVPRYYVQNFGSAISHPDTNEYAAFVQDTIRLTRRLAVSLGVRYDLQTFSTRDLVTNPLWPNSGKVPNNNTNNFSPGVGVAYSVGDAHPFVVRAGAGLFYTRIPQIYTSTIATDNGLGSTHLLLSNADFYDRQIFPTYPQPLVSCAITATFCAPPEVVANRLQTEISTFAPNFKTPRVEQASLSMEKEIVDRLAVGVNYLYVHGVGLIRARDVNLPPPMTLAYPIYDSGGNEFAGTYYNVDSFSSWQETQSLTCPFPPCINALARPSPQLGAVNQFESAASSVYNAFTVSVQRRMTHGLYFRLSYTLAHAVDDGQDALVAGRPATVQNSYSPRSERGPSVTDQRNRLAFSWVVEPRPFDRAHALLGTAFNNWKVSGVFTYGSGRPVNARVYGDPNQDGNDGNDRLPYASRNSFVGPDYATFDGRLTRRLYAGARLKIDLMAESFNLFNRDNKRVQITDDGFINGAGQFVGYSKTIGVKHFPAYYARPASFMAATDAYAPRQMQLGIKLIF